MHTLRLYTIGERVVKIVVNGNRRFYQEGITKQERNRIDEFSTERPSLLRSTGDDAEERMLVIMNQLHFCESQS